jgi:class 3 adenylate cyclase
MQCGRLCGTTLAKLRLIASRGIAGRTVDLAASLQNDSHAGDIVVSEAITDD